jgi:hypothetical protein
LCVVQFIALHVTRVVRCLCAIFVRRFSLDRFFFGIITEGIYVSSG